MALLQTPALDAGFSAPDFDLPGVDERRWTLADVRGAQGTVILFICNHCPYVKAINRRLVHDFTDLKAMGVGAAAIMSNDPHDYPEDSFENMQRVARELGYPFPYLLDAEQSVARAYGAVCTPDFFGFDADLQLVYRGRLDDGGRGDPERRELVEAYRELIETSRITAAQRPSMGCSIKWSQS